MKTLLIIALGLVCSIAVQAAPNILVEQGNRVRAIAKTLPGVPSDWAFTIVNEATFQDIVRKNRNSVLHNSAASNLAARVTFINQHWAVTATDYLLRQTLAHEMGHRMCGCQDEDKANKIEQEILKGEIQ